MRSLLIFLFILNLANAEVLKECRSRIPAKVCLVKPGTKDVCKNSPETKQIGERLQALYDFFPRPLRFMLCTLKKVFIDSDHHTIAQAEGDSIRIQKSVLENKLTLSEALTQKERKALGLDPQGNGCPKIVAGIDGLKDEYLAYAVAHELGHVADHSLKATGFQDGQDKKAPPIKGSFTQLAWKAIGFDGDIPVRKNNFAGRNLFHYYSSVKKRRPIESQVSHSYAGLKKSNFLTMYAASNTTEDFAESFGILNLASTNKFKFEVQCPPNGTFDVVAKVRSDQFREKADWIRSHFVESENFLLEAIAKNNH